MIPLSVLDLSPIVQGGDARQALANTLDLAQHAERWGYRRYWLAEHHNLTGVASAATSVVIGHVAERHLADPRGGRRASCCPTTRPWSSPSSSGRWPPSSPGGSIWGSAARRAAIRRSPMRSGATSRGDVDQFPRDVLELQSYFRPAAPGQAVQAVPGAGLEVPLWILGSSTFGAQLAARLGLPFAFASHFAPAELERAVALYRADFQPSEQLDRALRHAGGQRLRRRHGRRGAPAVHLAPAGLREPAHRPSGPPAPAGGGLRRPAAPEVRAMLDHALACSIVGSPETVRAGLAAFAARTGADELMVTAQIYDHRARLRSFEILAEAHASAVR